MTTHRPSSVERHLEICEDDWKAAHDQAMEVVDFEEYLPEFIGVYDIIEGRDDFHRSLILRGLATPGTGRAEAVDSYARWLAVASMVEAKLAGFTAEYGQLSREADFRDRVRRAHERLARHAPKLAISPGSRVWEVTTDEAAELSALASAPSTLTITPTSVPTGPASLIR